MVIVFIMFSRSASSSPEKTTTTTSSVSAAAKPSPTPIEYTEMDVIQLLGALKTNALAAKEAYQNQYVSLTGKLSNIDADGKYISLSANTDGYEYMFDSIHCSIKTDEIKKAVMDMRVGDIITVKGKITDVGEVLGYYLTIDQFG